MNFEKFDPSDKKYKKVEDLPEEKQAKFENVSEGFVTKEAADTLRRAEYIAKAEYKRQPIDVRIMRKIGLSKGSTPVDILREEAELADKQRENAKKRGNILREKM